MNESNRADTPLRLLFAGHDLKFASDLIASLGARPEVRDPDRRVDGAVEP